jgi:hypothetical protein
MLAIQSPDPKEEHPSSRHLSPFLQAGFIRYLTCCYVDWLHYIIDNSAEVGSLCPKRLLPSPRHRAKIPSAKEMTVEECPMLSKAYATRSHNPIRR